MSLYTNCKNWRVVERSFDCDKLTQVIECMSQEEAALKCKDIKNRFNLVYTIAPSEEEDPHALLHKFLDEKIAIWREKGLWGFEWTIQIDRKKIIESIETLMKIIEDCRTRSEGGALEQYENTTSFEFNFDLLCSVFPININNDDATYIQGEISEVLWNFIRETYFWGDSDVLGLDSDD